MKIIFLGLVAVHLFTTAILATPIAKLRDFQLADQDARTRVYRFPKTKITVMAVADYRGAGQLTPWIQRIYHRYQERIDIDGVADVSMIPEFFRSMLREAFKRQLTYSVMLDWDGSVVKQFAYEKNVANIYLIDRSGKIATRLAGAVNDDALRALFQGIDAAIAETQQNEPSDF
jgi:hypothetical protein